MKYTTDINLTLFIIAILINLIQCDIPVHCLKSQIIGKWKIHATSVKHVKNLYKFSCGHRIPSHENHSFLVKPKDIPHKFSHSYIVELKENDDAIIHINKKKLIGKWTMIYNEGFDILVNNRSYFAFSKYSKNDKKNKRFKTKWVSQCYSTLVGWYHIGKEKWGCFYAKKIVENPNQVTNGEPNGKLMVVEGRIKKINNSLENKQKFAAKNRFKSVKTEIGPKEIVDLEKQNNRKNAINNLKSKDKYNVENIIDSLSQELSFLETSEKVNVSNNFKDHKKVVDTINSITDLWEATNYHEFSSMTIEQLNNFAGRKKRAHPYRFQQNLNNNFNSDDIKLNPYQNNNSNDIPSYNSVHLSKSLKMNNIWNKQHYPNFFQKQKKSHKTKEINSSNNKDFKYNDMPKNYKKDMIYMTKARNQGACGSCYAMSTIGMLEARLRKQTNNAINERLSIQHILSCSVYNQGCGGGYAYLAMKFGAEVELIPESCMKYKERNLSCSKRCNRSKLKRVYKVKDYKYIGGSYGKCNEYDMMKEVLKNGPIVVSFEPDYLFMHYKKGIYKSVAHTWLTKGNKKPLWQKVDHSVVLVGWGYDDEKKIPYWILQNSWGPHWGENGYFKMLRGVDHLGIESICESGIPYHIDL